MIFPRPNAGNSQYSAFASGVLTKVSSIGRRVTIFEPLGKNSCPTIASRTELFPEDCEPITTMDGKVNVPPWPIVFRMLRISIIFRVSTIIWSSVAISVGARSSSSADCSTPIANADVAAVPATVLVCLGCSGPESPSLESLTLLKELLEPLGEVCVFFCPFPACSYLTGDTPHSVENVRGSLRHGISRIP